MSTSSLSIRAATVADAAMVTALITELNISDGYPISASQAALEKALFGGGRVPMRCLLAVSGETVLALALYYEGYDTVSATYGYHLADIVVTKDWQRRGVGTVLFNALAAQVLAEQGEWISLTVLKKNSTAKRFYKRRGMVEVAVNFMAMGPQALKACAQR